MCGSLRMFDCPRCKKRVFICRCCDRGHVYCSPECSRAARRASLRRAGERYRKTLRGRLNHARRQERYRRRKKNETHQGSPSFPSPPKQAPGPKRKEPGPHEEKKIETFSFQFPSVGSSPGAPVYTCSFCGRTRSPYLRIDFLHSPSRRRE